MKAKIKKIILKILRLPIIDLLLLPIVAIPALILLSVRIIGLHHLKLTKKLLLKIGVIPVQNHYYEPFFDKRSLLQPLSKERELPGIDWNIPEQLSILSDFNYNNEFRDIPNSYNDDLTFHFNNGAFESGDAEYWYNLIRLKKPKVIIEIGSGNSTKMAQRAIKENIKKLSDYNCQHICIEPYKMAWLEKLGITIIRDRVETIDKSIFDKLGDGDILFIDSSHMIRPQGDVLFEYLELLPTLKKGVIVHIHDIFSPRNYPESWILDEMKLWNEQFLLEAFLTNNDSWKIIGALNFLHHNYFDKLQSKCPLLTESREPGSFYIVKK